MKRPCILLAMIAVLLTSSCTHKPLDFAGVADLTVEFDWSAVPNANPSSMMLAAFSSGSQPVQKPLQGKSGGGIMLPEGDYQLIGYNEDTEVLFTRGNLWESFEICSQLTDFALKSRMFSRTRAIPRGAGTENQDIIEEPDPLWTSAYEKVTVTGMVGRKIRMDMEEATYVLNFTIRNVENIDYINEVLATISGMSGSWLPAQHRCSDTECLIPFTLSADGKSLTGSVRTFGHRLPTNEDDEVRHLLVVYTEMTDGSKLYYTFDVTDKVYSASPANNGEVTIELDGLPLPKPIENKSTGLDPDVVDWEEIIVPIKM